MVRVGFAWAVIFAYTGLSASASLAGMPRQSKPTSAAVSPSAAISKAKKPRISASTKKFSERADALLAPAPASKGEWGLLIIDAETGETLYELNADSYFLPASNMKLFTTALALAKLGPDYRFRTTLETRGTISTEGVLTGDLFLVGRLLDCESGRSSSFLHWLGRL